jgi:hypothetical protein
LGLFQSIKISFFMLYCGSSLSVGVEVRRNIDGIPKPEVWCLDCVRVVAIKQISR